MPEYMAPGVYIDEMPNGIRPISGAATAVTAFVGSAARGEKNNPVRLRSFGEYTDLFGELSKDQPMGFAVDQFFKNGGQHALIVRVCNSGAAATGAISDAHVSDPALEAARNGIWALEKVDRFNLLCIPPYTLDSNHDIGAQTRCAAASYCHARGAIFIADPLQGWHEPSDIAHGVSGLDGPTWGLARNANTAVYFPRIVIPNPLQAGGALTIVPCGTIAGLIARTDATRGVWKAPAGLEASMQGVTALTMTLTDRDNDMLNALGVNCLRSFPPNRHVPWGARTLVGTDHSAASEWQYLPIRRLALFLEESISQSTQWVVLEPNGEPLWDEIRRSIEIFMQNLFRQGAFQGKTPNEAYFVKCGPDTTTQTDIDRGIIIAHIGFAALKPAEFIIFQVRLQTASFS